MHTNACAISRADYKAPGNIRGEKRLHVAPSSSLLAYINSLNTQIIYGCFYVIRKQSRPEDPKNDPRLYCEEGCCVWGKK